MQIVTADAAVAAEAVIRDPRPAIFIHIPKTAGTAALRATAPYATPLGHRWIETAPTLRELASQRVHQIALVTGISAGTNGV